MGGKICKFRLRSLISLIDESFVPLEEPLKRAINFNLFLHYFVIGYILFATPWQSTLPHNYYYSAPHPTRGMTNEGLLISSS